MNRCPACNANYEDGMAHYCGPCSQCPMPVAYLQAGLAIRELQQEVADLKKQKAILEGVILRTDERLKKLEVRG